MICGCWYGSYGFCRSFTGAPLRGSFAAVQLALVDVADDAVGYQVPDRFTLRDPGAAVRGRDRQCGHLHQRDPALGQAVVRQQVTRAGHTDEVGEREQLLGVPPGQDLGQRVGAGDEEEVRVAVGRAQIPQRVDRVRRSATVDVAPADRELRVGRRRDDRHQVTVLGRGHLLVTLLPGLPGRDEDDFVQLEVGGHFTGRHQVSVMDRVKGPAHHADSALAAAGRHFLLSHACRPYWYSCSPRTQRSRLKRVVIHSRSNRATSAPPPVRYGLRLSWLPPCSPSEARVTSWCAVLERLIFCGTYPSGIRRETSGTSYAGVTGTLTPTQSLLSSLRYPRSRNQASRAAPTSATSRTTRSVLPGPWSSDTAASMTAVCGIPGAPQSYPQPPAHRSASTYAGICQGDEQRLVRTGGIHDRHQSRKRAEQAAQAISGHLLTGLRAPGGPLGPGGPAQAERFRHRLQGAQRPASRAQPAAALPVGLRPGERRPVRPPQRHAAGRLLHPGPREGPSDVRDAEPAAERHVHRPGR